MRHQVLDVSPEAYTPHRVHGDDRIWLESNCAADLWIEVLHALGLEPLAAMGFLVSSGFDGEQWRMFKFLIEDVRRLYGSMPTKSISGGRTGSFDRPDRTRPHGDHRCRRLVAP